MPTTNLPTGRQAVTATATISDLDRAEVIYHPDRDVVTVRLAGTAGHVDVEGTLADVYAQVIELDRQLGDIVRPTN